MWNMPPVGNDSRYHSKTIRFNIMCAVYPQTLVTCKT